MVELLKIYALTKRNIKLRYKNSIIGFFWGFLKPFLYLLVFILIFSSQFLSLENYILYVTSGLIIWFYFSNVAGQVIQSVISSADLIKSIQIPSIYFPIAELTTEFFNLCLMFIVFLILMYPFGIHYNLKILLFIPALILFSLFTLGFSLVLSALNVFLRDVGILWNTILPAFFYITPVAYPISLIPLKYQLIVKLNPVYYFIELFRHIVYYPDAPSLKLWTGALVGGITSFIIGYLVFKKLSRFFISCI